MKILTSFLTISLIRNEWIMEQEQWKKRDLNDRKND